ncbi:hypothetical protein R1sor_000504 [Riccia sorocarpa]|uniref:Uncharacterized protein n=1 Tax=Riccia sorocarpa TaxID=122646 RepID=A0ABD3GVP2_9MARC
MSKVHNLQEPSERLANVSSKFRTDLKRQNLQKSREKYFSPPKKPWDFPSFSHPKRLWDISPPYRREVQKASVQSAALKEASRDSNKETRTICGLCPHNPGIGRQRWHANALYQENPTEENVAKPSTIKKPNDSIPNQQVKVNIHASSREICPSWLAGSDPLRSKDVKDPESAQKACPNWFEGSNPSPKASDQDTFRTSKNPSWESDPHDDSKCVSASKICSPTFVSLNDSSPQSGRQDGGKASTIAASEAHGFKGSQGNVHQPELSELENLKVQLLLLCEKLALNIMRSELRKCNGLDSIPSTNKGRISKALGNLEDVLVSNVITAHEAARGGGEVEQEATSPRQCLATEEELSGDYRSQIWRVFLCIIFQITFWYFVMVQPVHRCIHSLVFLPPT